MDGKWAVCASETATVRRMNAPHHTIHRYFVRSSSRCVSGQVSWYPGGEADASSTCVSERGTWTPHT